MQWAVPGGERRTRVTGGSDRADCETKEENLDHQPSVPDRTHLVTKGIGKESLGCVHLRLTKKRGWFGVGSGGGGEGGEGGLAPRKWEARESAVGYAAFKNKCTG